MVAVYYCLYSENGLIEPKDPFKTYAGSAPSVARIEKSLIPPPHDLDAVIRCISFVERFETCVWHQLYLDTVSESPRDDLDVWDMRHGCSGSLPERPLVFVQSAGMKRRISCNSCHTYCM